MSMLDGLLDRPTHRLTAWQRFQAKMVGMDTDLLERSPERDVHEGSRCFWLLILVAAYQCVVFASLAHVLLAEPGKLHPEFFLLAALPAILVGVLEAALVIAPSYLSSGIHTLSQAGLEMPNPWGRRAKKAMAITLRLTFALACAQLGSIAITLPLLGKDTTAALDQAYRQSNAILFEQADARHTETLRRNNEELDQLHAQLSDLKTEEERWRRASIDPTTSDPELVALLARVEQLRSVKGAADQELAAAEQFANDELMGKQSAPGNSGRMGYGPVRRAADEAVANARRKVEAAASDLREAEARLAPLRERLAASAQGKSSGAETRLAEVTRERDALDERAAVLDERVRTLIGDRERLIREAVEADPGHVKKEDGILARVHAVRNIVESDSAAFVIVLLFDVVLFFIEVAVLLSKSLAAPTTYATLLAYAHVVGAHKIVQEIARTLNDVEAAPEKEEPPSPAIQEDRKENPVPLENGETKPAEEADLGVGPAHGGTKPPEADLPKRGRGRPPGSPNRPRAADLPSETAEGEKTPP
ncbi:hypothetical protein HNR60_003302 [Rhodopseudomonas rhenobacensis]|uniref:Uncharacterized protein n=1 Tax=Rhodopseudomonas rhenobacensis TaxID=87461 RepID=A0A7W7Z5S1_9BRAD|nr:DUF4407 domain-containing protein [Rhodopseudomonas rhenobacensis]MBB5048535.1 hypothetical protein [Rhodopseudomonas rhenobacensis]